MATPAERPLVSIVTPSLNQARWLREAIESVRAQTYERVEHVIVDGGSTDGTLELLREYADAVRFVSEPDRGQSHALNKGFSLAQGAILGWLNADDAYEPGAVAEGVAALEASGAGLVYADVVRVNDDRVNPRRIPSRPHWNLWTELNEGCGIYSPAVFLTREALEAVGGVDESLHYVMDYDLWLRVGQRFSIVRVDAVWALQRQHAAAKSVADKERFWPERLAVSRRHGGRLVSPLLVRRHVHGTRTRRLVMRAVGGMYALAGKRASR